MKTISKYVDEISGKEFPTETDALKSEKKNGGIKRIFSFWKPHPKEEGCDFTNGGWCYQRKESEFQNLVSAIILAVERYEPYIKKSYEKHGGLKREYVKGGTILGRYLSDGESEIYSWFLIMSEICPECFRQWGQPHYAINCKHKADPRSF